MIIVLLIFVGIVALVFLYCGAAGIWHSDNDSYGGSHQGGYQNFDNNEEDIKEIIVPDKVDTNESTLKSTQAEDAKKYVVNMNNTKIEKNVVKDGQVVRKEDNKIEYNEFDDFINDAKNKTSAIKENDNKNDDEGPIKENKH